MEPLIVSASPIIFDDVASPSEHWRLWSVVVPFTALAFALIKDFSLVTGLLDLKPVRLLLATISRPFTDFLSLADLDGESDFVTQNPPPWKAQVVSGACIAQCMAWGCYGGFVYVSKTETVIPGWIAMTIAASWVCIL